MQEFIASCAKALKACPKGQNAIYAGGQALLQDDGSLARLGKIAAATGATLICENAFPRIDRGAGLLHFQVGLHHSSTHLLSSATLQIPTQDK